MRQKLIKLVLIKYMSSTAPYYTPSEVWLRNVNDLTNPKDDTNIPASQFRSQ